MKKTLRTNRGVSKEYRDYILIKDVYHCSPAELDNVEERVLDLHYNFLMEERKHEYIESKRAEQKRQAKSSFPKKR